MIKENSNKGNQEKIKKLLISRLALLEIIITIKEIINDKSLSSEYVRELIEGIIVSHLTILDNKRLLFIKAPKSLEAHE